MFHYYSFIIATCNKAEFLWKSDVYLSTFILAKKKSSKFYYNTWRNYFKNQQTSQQSSMNKVTLKLTTSYWEREVLLMLWLLFASGSCWWTGRLGCCSPWGNKESDMTERLNWRYISCSWTDKMKSCLPTEL